MTSTCKNCSQNFKGHFCSNCGQSSNTHEINLKYFLHEIQHGLLHIDKGILYTTKQLFTKPGHSIRDYINGKRVKHFKPIAYVFIVCTIYALLSKISHENTFLDDISIGFTEVENVKNKPLGALTTTLNWLKNHYAYGALLLIPIFSLASYLAFRKSNYNYFKHLILNCYITGQRTLVYILIVPIISLFNNKNLTENAQEFKLIIGIILTFWTYMQFFNNLTKSKSFFLTILMYFYLSLCFLFLVLLIGILTGISRA